ncbi:MAG: hypothetical protein JHC61_04605 [Burkholderiaceae bacterium]|nr:hypothetical protein [Burkholderiaceae bacterium]
MKKIATCMLIIVAAAFSPQASAQFDFRKAFCAYMCKNNPGEGGTVCNCDGYPL